MEVIYTSMLLSANFRNIRFSHYTQTQKNKTLVKHKNHHRPVLHLENPVIFPTVRHRENRTYMRSGFTCVFFYQVVPLFDAAKQCTVAIFSH